METAGKTVKMVFFGMNMIIGGFALIVAVSQYLLMRSHFGGYSSEATTQGVHTVVVSVMLICAFLATRIKRSWISTVLSILLLLVLLVYFCIIVAVR